MFHHFAIETLLESNRAIYFLQIIGFVSHWNEELQNGRKYFSIFFRSYFTYQNFIKINSISFDKMKYIKECEKAIVYKDSKLLSNVFTNWFCKQRQTILWSLIDDGLDKLLYK